MNSDQLRPIKPCRASDVIIQVPPSKSYTNRALITAALARGDSTIINPSSSDDSLLLIDALRQFGISILPNQTSLTIIGSGGVLDVPSEPLYVGNAGTVLRFLSALAILVQGKTTIKADSAMNHRPIDELLSVLNSMGAHCYSTDGHPPISINGGHVTGGNISVNGSQSSQFLSALLLISPLANAPVDLSILGAIRSGPYVAMTTHIMQTFGVHVKKISPSRYFIDIPQNYRGTTFTVESDASGASYFFAAAAITKGNVRIPNLPSNTLQGDIAFLNLLVEMGCKVDHCDDGITLRGRTLHGINADMGSMPDCVPSLAVVACFAKGQTTITNIGHLRYKESDRLTAVATELRKLGVDVIVLPEALTIIPRPLHGAIIETYNDHRIAMSFAIAGLMVDGVIISNPRCVSKSFPTFWDEFKKLEQ